MQEEYSTKNAENYSINFKLKKKLIRFGSQFGSWKPEGHTHFSSLCVRSGLHIDSIDKFSVCYLIRGMGVFQRLGSGKNISPLQRNKNI